MNIESLKVAEFDSGIVAKESQKHHIALENMEHVRALFSKNAFDIPFPKITYSVNETIVQDGKIVLPKSAKTAQLEYSEVPLGYITKGSVTVVKGEKGTKTLSKGDFIGLFETSDWLITQKKRNIGDWTLTAQDEVDIIFFPKDFFSAHDSSVQAFESYLTELARQDAVPQPITNMPLLDWVAEHTTNDRLKDYAIVAHTHLLPNNVPFFRHLAHLVGFGRMTVLAKPYSTVPSAYNQLVESGIDVVKVKMERGMPYEFTVQQSAQILWKKIVEDQKRNGWKKLLVIDDGGDLWLSLPWESLHGVEIAGVEQTQRGVARIQHSDVRIPPIVSVASAGTKKIVESLFIGRSVVDKLKEDNLLQNRIIGILGMGSIGAAAYEHLQKENMQTLFYDPAHVKTSEHARNSIDSLINDADLIIGTTGTDALKGIALDRIRGKKIFTSASSADVEFGTLLQFAEATDDHFATRTIEVNKHFTAELLNGGYPLNFDRTKDATPSEDIVLTRCMMYIGAMQAVQLIESNTHEDSLYYLDVESQRHMLNRWIEYKKQISQQPEIAEKDISSIVKHSKAIDAKEMKSIWKA